MRSRRIPPVSGLGLSAAGRAFLMAWEGGVRLKAYPDSAGYLTIGVGHLITETEGQEGAIRIGGETIDWRSGLTTVQAESLFSRDAQWAVRAVRDLVQTTLSTKQRDAVISFVFNIGKPHFSTSNLLLRLNEPDMAAAASQFLRWVSAGGEQQRGLVRRRRAERALFLGGEYEGP